MTDELAHNTTLLPYPLDAVSGGSEMGLVIKQDLCEAHSGKIAGCN